MKSTILLVEDEAGLADSLKTEFELENFNVFWANDGLIALDMFRQNEAQIDLIILDWMLPHIQDQETQLITVLIGIGWIAMVAISRVYLRDHYLSDVLASVCLASRWWLLVTPAEAFIQAKMRQFLPEGMLKSWPHQN
ncbi:MULTISPECIES: phosphatase PAP2 family protein [Lactobacillaceae]|uniref:DNA-binding response regulator OmpR family n=1 Tax=Levilactobacillus brevis TaxID=1580 RepID=A0A5B7Y3D8_LEVBR|nr:MULTISPECIES: phosphatase PAP2 family protein [Lactobacillaceae]OLF68948.1 hypothetical protein ACX53_10535 [Loigolactobacillus backii]PIO88542.1 hypothetical protein B8A32_00635 [Loigolactobacillus backii]QCZ54538.1 DNA-binding response regulator OmpR family [Levilactobacillus brevis]